MSRWIKIALALLILITASAGSLAFYGYYLFSHDTKRPYGEIIFTIERGAGLSRIAAQLEEAGIISHRKIFMLGTMLQDKQTSLKAGEYKIPPCQSMQEVLDHLVSGDVIQYSITIREGLTSWEVLEVLRNTDGLIWDDSIEIPSEGSLLPETYRYTRGDTAKEKITRMQEVMTETIEALWPERQDGLPFSTKEEAIILASIVEKETSIPSERKKVAGVFINRLHKGMKLQTDPTVIYAMTEGAHQSDGQGPIGRRLLRKDLKIDSPYNTYKYAGLPPGPIANPGRASIEAVLNPDKHDYFYFVADGTGGHAFGKTLTEHNSNVAKWRKIKQSQKNP